jgi:opacity protein-like surface antigen
MKKLLFIIVSVVLIAGIVFAMDVVFKEYSAYPGSDRVTLTFETKSETGVAVFLIMRSLDDRTFRKVETVQPHGINKKYEFTDKSVYKTTQTFFYKIRAQRKDDSIIEETQSLIVNPNISSNYKATWGAIKQMFNR